MNKQEKYTEDTLKHYLNPEQIEKAPEGFTSKVMAQIQIMNSPVKDARRFPDKSLVPVISSLVTVILIAVAFLIPGSSDTFPLPVTELFKNMKLSLPEIDLSSFSRLNIPVTLIYGLFSILILSLLDRALHGVLHRWKQSKGHKVESS